MTVKDVIKQVDFNNFINEQLYNWSTGSRDIIVTRISKSGHIYIYNKTTHKLMGSVKRK